MTDVFHNKPWESLITGGGATDLAFTPVGGKKARIRRVLDIVFDKLLGPGKVITTAPKPAVPCMVFLPDHTKLETITSWWFFTPELIQEFLAILGFEKSKVTYHQQNYRGGYTAPCYTVVGCRK